MHQLLPPGLQDPPGCPPQLQKVNTFKCSYETAPEQWLSRQDNVDAGRECSIKGLCMCLSDLRMWCRSTWRGSSFSSFLQDRAKAKTLSAIERMTVGVYVARETPGSKSSDVGVIREVLLHNLENVPLATALLSGPVNMSFTSSNWFKALGSSDAAQDGL
ncbi:hypothetical protein SRHO_G00343960 [Serrasalmus rhombeus]